MPKVKKWSKRRRYLPSFATMNVATNAEPARAAAEFDDVSEQQLVPLNENLLERSRTQWQLGDWAGLVKLSCDTLQHHPDRAELALLVAAGQIQSNNMSAAYELFRQAQGWGCSKELASQVLVAGDQELALTHYETATSTTNASVDGSMMPATHVMLDTPRLDVTQQTEPPPAFLELPKPDVGIRGCE